MTRAELIQQVALKMDEVSPNIEASDLTVDGSDGNPLYTLIDGLIDGGALELFSVAPYWRLPQSEFSDKGLDDAGSQRVVNDGETTIAARKMIWLRVPDDFLRVAEINHGSFQRPITDIVQEDSPLGKRQHNPFLMAREARPVGVMSHDKRTINGNAVQCREIDCYSIPSSGAALTSLVATYIPKPQTIVDDPVTPSNSVAVETAIPTVLIPALEWLVAARTFGARGDANHAAICQQNAQNVLV